MIQNLQRVLHYFELISGLKTNFYNSSLVGLNTNSSFLSAASSFLCYKVKTLHIKYPGLTLSNKKIVVSAGAPVMDRIQQKLTWCDDQIKPFQYASLFYVTAQYASAGVALNRINDEIFSWCRTLVEKLYLKWLGRMFATS